MTLSVVDSGVELWLPTVDVDGICASQTPAAGGLQYLMINGALATIDKAVLPAIIGTGLVVRITCAGVETANATITGTLGVSGGVPVVVTETIALPSTGFVDTTQLYDTVTSVNLDDASATATEFGTAADDDGIILSAVLPSGEQTIDGAFRSGTVNLSESGSFTVAARKVDVTPVGDETARTFTFTGTNRRGETITEAITGGNTVATTTLLDFLTIISITVDNATAAAVQVGGADSLSSPWIKIAYAFNSKEVGLFAELNGAATVDYSVEWTPDEVDEKDEDLLVFQHEMYPPASLTPLFNLTTDSYGLSTVPVQAFRLTLNSYTSAAGVTVRFAPRQLLGGGR